MQRSLSTRTTPPSPFEMAPAGHTDAHAGTAQCMHDVDTCTSLPAISYVLTVRRASTLAGVRLHSRQASTHSPQSTQFLTLSRNPYCIRF